MSLICECDKMPILGEKCKYCTRIIYMEALYLSEDYQKQKDFEYEQKENPVAALKSLMRSLEAVR